jgi:hypothetical protein
MKLDEEKREQKLLTNQYQLAVLYVDMHKIREAEPLMTSLLEKYERYVSTFWSL